MAGPQTENLTQPVPKSQMTFLAALRQKLSVTIPVIGAALIGLFVLGIAALIFYAIINPDGLAPLERTERARGLITFLVAIVTVLIAVILSLYAITTTDSEAKDRFMLGKEVLTILIGVLGTIVGFYFGAATTNQPVTEAMQIARPFISNSQLRKGDSLLISSYVSGGSSPYTYSITFDPGILPGVKNVLSIDGGIRQMIRIPAMTKGDTGVLIQILVKDRNGKSVVSNKSESPTLSIRAE